VVEQRYVTLPIKGVHGTIEKVFSNSPRYLVVRGEAADRAVGRVDGEREPIGKLDEISSRRLD
jgi:hypothetical protein